MVGIKANMRVQGHVNAAPCRCNQVSVLYCCDGCRGRALLWLLEVVDQVNALTRRADLVFALCHSMPCSAVQAGCLVVQFVHLTA